MRTLASIRKIEWLKPIEGRDRIELAGVLGWQVIVKREEFAVGDLCVFCEIDSVLPEKPEFEFLRPKNFRIRTMKLGSTVSQGIVFPLSILPPKKKGEYELDEDVTAVIGVTQYEPTMDKEPDTTSSKKTKWPRWLMRHAWFRSLVLGKKKKKGGFPSFISKTDEVRCLEANTKVLTDDGIKRISDICRLRLPVRVMSFNEKDQKFEFKKIVDYQTYERDNEMIEISFHYRPNMNRKNRIRCTKDHRLLTQDGYKLASDLTVDDSVCYMEQSCGEDALPAIYGMLLGDSSVSIDKRIHIDGTDDTGFAISTCHGEKQYSYLKFKQELFGEEYFVIHKGISGYKINGSVFHGTLKRDPLITQALISDGCIQNKKFFVTQKFCERLTPLSLAIWYMDDGTCRHLHNEIYQYATAGKSKPAIEISTNSFSIPEVELLISTLRDRFDIVSNMRISHRNKKIYPSIYIPVDQTPKFLSLIAPFVPECMRYKLTDEAREIPFSFDGVRFERKNRIFTDKILSVKTVIASKYAQKAHVFDLEIEDNHNFVANGIIHHNCQNIPGILQDKREWVMSEKADGASATFALVRHKRCWPLTDKFEYIVCSRNLRLGKPDNSSYWRVSEKYKIENALRNMIGDRDWIAIQGECLGPKIQGNKYNLSDYDLYVFNLIYPTGRLGSVVAKSIIENKGLNFVPILDEHYVLPDTMEQALKDATGASVLGNTLREGVVCRSPDGKQSFKIVSPEFLLKYNE